MSEAGLFFVLMFELVYKELHTDYGNGLLTTRRRYDLCRAIASPCVWGFQKGFPFDIHNFTCKV